jgi:hypothetical protein
VAAAHPEVAIGSYPQFDATDHAVKLTLESRDREAVEVALRVLLGVLPEGAVVRVVTP